MSDSELNESCSVQTGEYQHSANCNVEKIVLRPIHFEEPHPHYSSLLLLASNKSLMNEIHRETCLIYDVLTHFQCIELNEFLKVYMS